MEDNFNIHLISNVSQDMYPDNCPSKFTTLLSNEVSLRDGRWEVGIHDIMYPSQINVNKDEDYMDVYKVDTNDHRKLFPQELVANERIQPYTVNVGKELYKKFPILQKEISDDKTIVIDSKTEKKFLASDYIPKTPEDFELFCNYAKKTKSKKYHNNIHLIAEKILPILNNLECVKKGFIGFRYSRKWSKFVMDVLKEDIMVILTRDLAHLLGFVYYQCWFTGAIWAQVEFYRNFHIHIDIDAEIYFVDIQTMQREEIPLTFVEQPCHNNSSLSNDNSTCLHYKVPYSVDTSNLNTSAIATLPKDLSFTLKFDFHKKQRKVKMESKEMLEIEHFESYETFAIYSLDLSDEQRNKYQMPRYIQFEFDFKNYKRKHKFKFRGVASDLQMNRKWIKMTPEHMTEIAKLRPKLIIYKMYARDFRSNYDYQKRINITMDTEKIVTTPTSLTFINNVNENDIATFSLNPSNKRLCVKLPKNTALKLSPSLSWKLGFTSICASGDCPYLLDGALANHFPILHRETHELYIYSNIIESGYVGDIKTPLLLVCPFNDQTKNALTHLQFQHISYKKLNRNTFQQIEIMIYNAFGQLINFSYGRTVINLHFRKISP